MGEIERKIWEEMQQNEDFRKILNKKMRETARSLASTSFFSETFRSFMRKVAEGIIEIY